MREHSLPLAALAVLAAVCYFAGSPGTGFQGTDELRYGQIAKELEPGKNLFLLHFNGVRYSDKPPLYFWMVALSYKAFGGVSAFALRVPGALSGIASVLLIYGIAWTLFRRKDLAFLSGATLMLMSKFLWIARWGRLDVPMCMFIYASMLVFARASFGGAARLAGWGFWIALGLSFAIKGPAGPIVILGAVVAFLLWQREGRRMKDLLHPGGIAAAIALNAAWVAPILLLGDAASSGDMVIRQNLGRVLDPWRHVEPFYYYGRNMWYDAFPAMLFAFFGAVYWFLNRKAAQAEGSATPARLFGADHAALRFLFSWFAFTVLFFSLYPPKRGQYLLPCYPAIAMGAVYFLDLLSRKLRAPEGEPRPSAAYFLIPGAISLLPLVLVVPVILWHHELTAWAAGVLEGIDLDAAERLREAAAEFEYGAAEISRGAKIAGTALALLAILAAGYLLLARRVMAAYAFLLGLTYCAIIAFFAAVIPPTLPDDDLRRIAADLKARHDARPDVAILAFGDDKPFFNIYGDFPVAYFEREFDDDFFALLEKVRGENRPVIILAKESRAKKVRESPLAADLARRKDSVRGEAVLIFETP